MSFLINIRLREFDELVNEALNMSYEEFETNKAIDAFITKIEEEIKKSFNISEFHTLSTKLEKYSIDELKRMADATAVIMKFTNKLPELFNKKRIQAKKEGKLIGFENVIIEMLNEPDGKKKIAKMISDAELLLKNSRVISNERRNMIEAQLDLMRTHYQKKPISTHGKKPQAPTIALFCRLVNDSKIKEKKGAESVESYCKRICQDHNLPYSDRVRQNFNDNSTNRHKKKLVDVLFPLIDKTVITRINEYLNTKEPTKNKMYI